MMKENCAWSERPWHFISFKCSDSSLSEFTITSINVEYTVIIWVAEQGENTSKSIYEKVYS